MTIDRVDAEWGVYGSLPMVVVSAPDAYMLVDATSGRVAGPFEPGSAFNADGLLSQHTNVWNGTPPVFKNRYGCEVAAIVPGYPPAPYRPIPVPAGPTPPFTTPGNPSAWTCVTVGPGLTAKCVCTATSNYDLPPGVTPPPGYTAPTIVVTTTCTYTGACDNPGVIPPSNITPPNGQCPQHPDTDVPPPSSPGEPKHKHPKP